MPLAARSGPLVSVVIPSYNHSQFIGQAIESVVNQTYRNIDLVVIDDGSTDNSMEVIRNLAEAHAARLPFTVRSRQNKGAHETINEGLSIARGDYLTILNSDDYYEPDRISLLVNEARERNGAFLYTETELVDHVGKPLHSDWYSEALEKASMCPTSSFYLVKANYAMTTGNFFFRRDLYEKVGPFADFLVCHDWDFILRVLQLTEPVFVRRKAMCYRLHGANTINSGRDQLVKEELEVVYKYFSSVSNGALKNKLAPCFANWGHYWTLFVSSELTHLMNQPRIGPILY